MSVQRFLGRSSRAVLKDVRGSLGDDAVVISNRTSNGSVEVLAMAATEMDHLVESAHGERGAPTKPRPASVAEQVPESFEDYLRRANTGAGLARPGQMSTELLVNSRRARAAAEYESVFSAQLEHPETVPTSQGGVREGFVRSAPQAAIQSQARPAPAAKLTDARPASFAAVAASDVNDDTARPAEEALSLKQALRGQTSDLMDEMRSMKGHLQDQLAQIAWSEQVRRNPVQAKTLSTLLHAGFSPILSRALIGRMPLHIGEAAATEWLGQVLSRNVKVCTKADSLIERGGIYALVGPTGAGKTTTVAKLAARAVVRFGAKSVGIVTIDHYRMGAHEQLRGFGKMLGCPVHIAHDAATLNDLLVGMRGKHLVLIDTIGVPQRDPKLDDQLSLLMGSGIERVVVLNASSQIETLEEVVSLWRRAQCTRAIISKIDEAVKLGGVVDVAVRHRLLLDSVSNGQRVPEDLHAANASLLVHRALRAAILPAFHMRDDELNLVAIQSTIGARIGAASA